MKMPNHKKNTPERLLTIREVATFCGVSEKTIRRWIESHELPAAKLGAQWRIRPRDLDLFIREHLNW
jgi:excisionase family DNA binding protein